MTLDEREMKELLNPIIGNESDSLRWANHVEDNMYDLVFDGTADPNTDWIFDKLQEAGWMPDNDEWRSPADAGFSRQFVYDPDNEDDYIQDWHVEVYVPEPAEDAKSVTETTKRFMGVKGNEIMTHYAWDKIHADYMRLLDDIEPVYKEAIRLRNLIEDDYDTSDPRLEPLAKIANGIVTNLHKASSKDPEGGIWWILQHSQDFKDS